MSAHSRSERYLSCNGARCTAEFAVSDEELAGAGPTGELRELAAQAGWQVMVSPGDQGQLRDYCPAHREGTRPAARALRHDWRTEGSPDAAVARRCDGCQGEGRRFRTGRGYTSWETRVPGGEWVTSPVPGCTAPPGPWAGITERALEIAPGQQWSSWRNGNVIRVTGVDDDLVAYERVSGTGRAAGSVRARSLLSYYAKVRIP